MASSKLQITQSRSLIGQTKTIRATLTGMGLGRIGKSVVLENTPSFRGMIKKVIHLVRVEEIHG
jgi:large subunit ribosomal protein L30